MSSLFGIFLVLLAAGEETSNRTLIYISLMGNGTLLIVAVLNNRKLSAVAELPQKVEELRKNTDGIQDELKAARLQTSEAKQEVARGEGKEQERVEERERQEAIAPAPGSEPADPVKMEIANPEIRQVRPGHHGTAEPPK